MLVRATVDATVLMERGCLEVNPTIDFDTPAKLRGIISDKIEDDDWSYLYLPHYLYGASIDLTEYLTIYPMEAIGFIPYSKDKEATKLTTLRLYCLAEVTDRVHVIDLEYIENDDTYKNYRLNKLTVYDEYGNENNYKYVFDIKRDLNQSSYIDSIKLNLETKELVQNTVLRDNEQGE